MRPDIDEKLRILQPAIGIKKANALRQMYFFEDDYRAKKEIENYLDLMISKHVKTDINDSIILPPPPLDACQGDINIGTVEYMKKAQGEFNLNLKDLTRHLGAFGGTGSGKTNFALNLIRQMNKQHLPYMVIDWERSYRNLIDELDNVIVFTLGSDINPLYLNPLHLPPGISKEEYSKSIISILSEDYLSGAGSDTVILNYLKTAYLEHQNPTFNDLKEIAAKDMRRQQRGRTMLWKETVGRIMSTLSIGTAGQVFGSGKHHPLDKLLEKNVVLELGGIQSPRDRKFIIHLILNWLFLWMQHRGIESEALKQTIIFEEFHNIAMKGQTDNFIGTMFRQSRKYGVALVALSQTPSDIPNEIYANMNTKVSFSLSTNRDITAMAKAMNLDNQKAKYLGMLETGQAIVNVKQRYHDPFLIRPPFIQQGKNITDEELKNKIDKDLLFSPLSLRQSFQDSGFPRFRHSETLPPLAKILLQNIAEKPFIPVSKRYKILGLSMAKGNDIQTQIIKNGYARAQTIDGMTLLELTPKGKEHVDLKAVNGPTYKGGIEHNYWIHQTVQYLSKKLKIQPVLEYQDIDISNIEAGIAIEIETGKSDYKKNISKLLKLDNSHFSKRFMLSTNMETHFKIKKLTKDHPSIKALHIKDFFKLTKRDIGIRKTKQ